MKTVSCPLCKRNIFSESFHVGERFPCPTCEQDLTVQPYEDVPVLKSSHDLVENMGWARGLWKNGRLFLNEEKLLVLGQFILGAIELEKWSQESVDDLKKRAQELERISKVLANNKVKDELYALSRSLLDLHISLRTNS